MRISDWSSDVCSSDLFPPTRRIGEQARPVGYAIDIHPRGKGVGTEGETRASYTHHSSAPGSPPCPGRHSRCRPASFSPQRHRRGRRRHVIVEVIEGTARSAAAAIVDLEHHIAVIDEILLLMAITDPAFVARTEIGRAHVCTPVTHAYS